MEGFAVPLSLGVCQGLALPKALSVGPSLTDMAMSAVYIPSRLHALGRQGFFGSLLRTFYFSHVCVRLGTKHFGF